MQKVQVRQLALEDNFADEARVKNLQLLCVKFAHVTDEQLEQLGIDIASQLSGAEFDTLWAVHENGPIDSGHLPSKTARDFLVDLGLIVMVVNKGEDGYWASSQMGHWAHKGLVVIKENPELKNPAPGELLGDEQANTEEGE